MAGQHETPGSIETREGLGPDRLQLGAVMGEDGLQEAGG